MSQENCKNQSDEISKKFVSEEIAHVFSSDHKFAKKIIDRMVWLLVCCVIMTLFSITAIVFYLIKKGYFMTLFHGAAAITNII